MRPRIRHAGDYTRARSTAGVPTSNLTLVVKALGNEDRISLVRFHAESLS